VGPLSLSVEAENALVALDVKPDDVDDYDADMNEIVTHVGS
jgi:hypothetical protein